MDSPFKIFPSVGYKNSQFQIVTTVKNLPIQLILNDNIEQEIVADGENPAVITKLKKPGKYQAVCSVNGKVYNQSIKVLDAYRLGSSELKAAYAFDGVDYSLLLMKDRLLLYNEKTNTLLTENGISPTDIRKVDEDTLLFTTKIGSNKDFRNNYGLFCTKSLAVIDELLNDFREICTDEARNLLWLYNIKSSFIICYKIVNSTFHEVYRVEGVDSFKVNTQSTKILISANHTVQIVDIASQQSQVVLQDSTNAVDVEGIVYYLQHDEIRFSGLEYALRLTNSHLNFDTNRFFYLGTAFKNDTAMASLPDPMPSAELESRLHESIDRTKATHIIDLTDKDIIRTCFTSVEYYPTANGAFLLVKTTSKEINRLVFKSDGQGDWQCSWNCITRNKYSITYQTKVSETELVKPTDTLRIVDYMCSTLVVKDASMQKVLRGNQSKTLSLKDTARVLVVPRSEKAYLIIESDSTYSLFNIDNLSAPIISRISIHNMDFLDNHLNIWYSHGKKNHINDAQYLKGYSLTSGKSIEVNEVAAQHSLFKDASVFMFKQGYISSSNKMLLNPKTGTIRYAAFGNIITYSDSLSKVITRRENHLYLLKYEADSKTYVDQEISIEQEKYQESYLSPDGNFLVLKKQTNEYVWYNIETGLEERFFSGKFLSFSKEGNLIIEADSTREVRIYDPSTFEDVTPPNYHHYRFISPDGKLYAQVSQKRRYYDKVADKEIDVKTLTELRNRLDHPSVITSLQEYERQKAVVQKNRNEYFRQHFIKLHQLGISDSSRVSTHTIIESERFTEIGIVGTDKVVEVHFPLDLTYYNYAAFSYDNQYFGYVGKPSSKGLIHLFKIDYDESTNKLEVVDSYLSRYPRYASWVCGFSKTGYFATYDSTPDTYIIKCTSQVFDLKVSEQELREGISQDESHLYQSYREWNEIHGKNFLCFSPSGEYLALSEQGYEPFTLGGYGHQESSALHIAETESGNIVDSFIGHGDKIKDSSSSKLAFVAFSEDEKRIMSMSADGVVVIRSLTLNS